MQEIPLTPDQETILNRFFKVGGIVDFVLMACAGNDDLASEETHRQAILLGMKSLQERLGYFSEFAIVTELGWLGSARAPLVTDEARWNELLGNRISKAAFLGPCYDEGRQALKSEVGPGPATPAGSPTPLLIRRMDCRRRRQDVSSCSRKSSRRFSAALTTIRSSSSGQPIGRVTSTQEESGGVASYGPLAIPGRTGSS